jgi:hypothetical protein
MYRETKRRAESVRRESATKTEAERQSYNNNNSNTRRLLRINSSGPQAGRRQSCIVVASAVRCNSRCIVLSPCTLFGFVTLSRGIPSMVIVFLLHLYLSRSFLMPFFPPPPCYTHFLSSISLHYTPNATRQTHSPNLTHKPP